MNNKCYRCKKLYHNDHIFYYKGDCICDKCLHELSDKFYQALGVYICFSVSDKYSISMDIDDFVDLVDMIKFDFNTLEFNIPLREARNKVENTD
jgi:hypothetical protein